MIGGRVLDPTAVMAVIEHTPYTDAMLAVANETNMALGVPTTALQSVWANCASAEREWLDQLPHAAMVVVLPLDVDTARDAGLLAARAGMPEVHLAAAHATLVGIRRRWPVLTRRPDIIQALSSDVRTETIPDYRPGRDDGGGAARAADVHGSPAYT